MEISGDAIRAIMSVIGGGGVSLAVWYYKKNIAIPKLKFSDIIKKVVDDEDSNKHAYKIKVHNSGKRSAIDVDFVVRFRYRRLKRTFHIVDVQGDGATSYSPKMNKKKGNRLIVILPKKNDVFLSAPFPDQIKEKARSDTLTIEDLLELKDAQLRVYVFAYDEATGIRQLYTSKKYTKNDIVEGIVFDTYSTNYKQAKSITPEQIEVLQQRNAK